MDQTEGVLLVIFQIGPQQPKIPFSHRDRFRQRVFFFVGEFFLEGDLCEHGLQGPVGDHIGLVRRHHVGRGVGGHSHGSGEDQHHTGDDQDDPDSDNQDGPRGRVRCCIRSVDRGDHLGGSPRLSRGGGFEHLLGHAAGQCKDLGEPTE